MPNQQELNFAKRLLEITEDCHWDMHEPVSQGVSAIVTGYELDNAMGDNPTHNCGEFTVRISRATDTGLGIQLNEAEWFNLAALIALARKEAARILDEQHKFNKGEK